MEAAALAVQGLVVVPWTMFMFFGISSINAIGFQSKVQAHKINPKFRTWPPFTRFGWTDVYQEAEKACICLIHFVLFMVDL